MSSYMIAGENWTLKSDLQSVFNSLVEVYSYYYLKGEKALQGYNYIEESMTEHDQNELSASSGACDACRSILFQILGGAQMIALDQSIHDWAKKQLGTEGEADETV